MRLSKRAERACNDEKTARNVPTYQFACLQIVGLTEVLSESRASVLQSLRRGAEQRTVAATAMNDQSSRSHAILTLNLRVQHRQEEADSCCAKFHLVDLAGSERVKKTHAEGDRFKEGK